MDKFDLQKVVIRPAVPADDSIVGEILVSAFLTAYQLKKPDFTVPLDRQAELRNVEAKRINGLVLIGEMNGKIIGTVTLYKHDSSDVHVWVPNYSELRYLALRPELHGTGLGRSFIEAAVSTCKEWESYGICLRVRRGLDGLAKYYERFGFLRDERGDQVIGSMFYLEGYMMKFDVPSRVG
ncbi:MAG: GNAT family N-acetyltransferase [Bdellovibrionota bacterium]